MPQGYPRGIRHLENEEEKKLFGLITDGEFEEDCGINYLHTRIVITTEICDWHPVDDESDVSGFGWVFKSIFCVLVYKIGNYASDLCCALYCLNSKNDVSVHSRSVAGGF